MLPHSSLLRSVIVCVAVLSASASYGQNIGINANGATPNASAVTLMTLGAESSAILAQSIGGGGGGVSNCAGTRRP